jgi:hypothetical protein
MSGDDLSAPQRLQRQLEEYRRGPRRVLFADVDFIGDDGGPLPGGHFAEGLFDLSLRSRAAILERFFFAGNFINAVTCFTEAEAFREVGPFDPLLFQLQDYDMWIRMVKRYELCFMREKLVRYRIRGGHANLSSPTPAHQVRSCNEEHLILARFFDGLCPDLFRQAFGKHLIRPDCRLPAQLACEQAFLFLRSNHPLKRLLGLRQLHALYSDPGAGAVLRRDYGVSAVSFAQLLQSIDAAGIGKEHELVQRDEALRSILSSRSWRLVSWLRRARHLLPVNRKLRRTG